MKSCISVKNDYSAAGASGAASAGASAGVSAGASGAGTAFLESQRFLKVEETEMEQLCNYFGNRVDERV
ncbi:MAG: hypothetical protein IIU46_01895 [Treponema sp.]|nr:hypothetical protein [Treponema sp.]